MSTDSAVLTPEETAESIGIPIDELEAWLNHEIEKRCQVFRYSAFECGHVASWIAYKKQCYSCGSRSAQKFICDEPCKRELDNNQIHCGERACMAVAEFLWVERIKS